MKVKEGLDWAVGSLKDIENPRGNAEILLEEILNLEKTELYLNSEEFLPQKKFPLFKKFVERRAQHFPLQYILGKSDFMGLEFMVNEKVMIPRPETEILVEKILEEVHQRASGYQPLTIVDLGTGCGNIAIGLAKNIPRCRVYALDISREALKVARKNARRHNLNGEIIFLEGDLFNPFRRLKREADIIVSNPPYIASDDFERLPPEVKFEPRLALDGGEGGLDFYERIITRAPRCLKKGGFLALEIGINQASQICNLIRTRKEFSDPEVIKDYGGIKRIILTRKSN
jgi:release factor glutamine methyltransferase